MYKLRLLFPFLMLLFTTAKVSAQPTFPQNGVYDERENCFAFINATIYTSFNTKIDNATLLIRQGKVESAGTGVTIPKEAVVINAKGKSIYPSFIDLDAAYGLPEIKGTPQRGFPGSSQMTSEKKGPFAWNQAMKPEIAAYEMFTPDKKAAEALLKQGFGSVLTHQHDGISRGTSALVSLGNGQPHELIITERAAHHLSFNKGSSKQSYPSSLMGSIALIRQTYLDGQWYEKQQQEVNASLKAWNQVQDLPQFFETRDHLEALRAHEIAKEFGQKYIIRGSGTEYRRIEAMKATGQAFILPLDFPEAYDVENPYDALIVSLAQLKHWELAPENPARMVEAGIEIALTTNGLSKPENFLKMVRIAVKRGLSPEDALKALTYTPAQLLGIYQKTGSLEPGKMANFFITDGDIFNQQTKIYHHWTQGKPNIFKELSPAYAEGKYELNFGGKAYNLLVKEGKLKIQFDDTTAVDVKSTFSADALTLSFQLPEDTNKIRLSGIIEGDKWHGKGQDGTGEWLSWHATLKAKDKPTNEKAKDKKAGEKQTVGPVIYPFVAHGWKEAPKLKKVLIRNATVWTN